MSGNPQQKTSRGGPVQGHSRYADAAIAQGGRLGIAHHGDDFVFGPSEVAIDEGAGSWFDSDDPKLVEWYTSAVEMPRFSVPKTYAVP